MKHLMTVAAIGLVALGGCGWRHEKKDDSGVKISINSDDKDAGWNGDDKDNKGVKLSLNLPGGFNAKLNVPGAMSEHGKFDIHGVGLYPGATVNAVDVNAGKATERTEVKIGFAAPGDASAVADWYQAQFEAKKITTQRSGDTFAGKNDDGADFTLALSGAGSGKSNGLLTILDSHKG
jgi:hypothetical protein